MANNLCLTIKQIRATRAVATRFLLSAAFLVCASPAFAGPQCTSEPAGKWAPLDELKKKVTERGYKIEVLKVTKGSCYELYGRDRNGKRVEIYYHPITFDVVRTTVR